jgi:carbon monoxide dehydrogenase subunit G
MIHFEGKRLVASAPADVFAKLGDAGFLVDRVKDLESVSVRTADRAVCRVRPNLSFIKSTLEVALTIDERIAPDTIRTTAFSKGIGASGTVKTAIRIIPRESGTGSEIHWMADITELTGLLKLVPKGIITSTATKIIDESWAELAKAL